MNMKNLTVDKLIHAIETAKTAAEKQNGMNELMARIEKQGAPLIENDTKATFFYHGTVESVGIIGDMTDWCRTEYFRQISGSNLFYWQAEFHADARLEYNLQINGDEILAIDPLNPSLSLNGLGPLSELAMPKYQHHPFFQEFRGGKKGAFEQIENHELPAGHLNYAHKINVYLPPGYAANKKKYPVVYFQDGEDYIECAQAAHVLNRLIREKSICPLIAVFESPPNRHLPNEPNRATQYGMNENYVKFFTEELAPFIDNHYRTRASAENRLVVGDSYGGLISTYIAFARTDIFGMAYSQSGYFSFQEDRLIRAFQEQKKRPLRLYVDIGHYERVVGAAFLPAPEVDFLAANRRFREVLADKGYDFIYREYPEGHTWGNWRRHLIDGLIHFFGVK